MRRFQEYNLIIKSNSIFTERFLNRNKYKWLVNEWFQKSKSFNFNETLMIVMPTVLYFIFIKRYLVYKIMHKK